MKRIITLALICMTVSALNAQKKVAVVTFFADKNIDFSGLDGNAALAASMASLSNDPNFDLKPILQSFHKAFFEDLKKDFPFELVDEGTVINNELYKSFENFGTDAADESKGILQHSIVIDGYKPLIEVSKMSADKFRSELQMLEIFKDVDGVMFVKLDYAFIQKMAVGGNGTAGINAFVRMKLWNREGDKVFAKNESASSKKSVPMVKGIPVTSPEKILPLCKSANERLIEDLKKKMSKLVSKVDKKL